MDEEVPLCIQLWSHSPLLVVLSGSLAERRASLRAGSECHSLTLLPVHPLNFHVCSLHLAIMLPCGDDSPEHKQNAVCLHGPVTPELWVGKTGAAMRFPDTRLVQLETLSLK